MILFENILFLSDQEIIQSTVLFIGPWRSVHIDDLRRSKDIVSDIKTLQSMKISQMFESKTTRPEGKRKMLNIYV